MHFDDRLATVLRQPATGEALARIQYRQLVDLLGALPAATARGPQLDAAWLRLAELSATIPPAHRAGILKQPGLRLRNPRLVAQLAEGEPAVASAAIAQAALSREEWLDLAPALPIAARGILRHRRDLGPEVDVALVRLGVLDRGLPAAAASIGNGAEPDAPAAPDNIVTLRPARPAEPAEAETGEAIRAIVRRIEEFRKTRAPAPPPHDAPRLPLGEPGALAGPGRAAVIDFATDADGRIVWADAAIAPMTVGLRLFGAAGDGDAGAAAFRRRQPIRAATLELAGAPAIAGPWRIDAAPHFDASGGRFTGYRGRMRRRPDIAETSSAHGSGIDRMRQILHELRTPVNAIQGFAEMTQQGLHGPLSHEYRSLAAAIAGDAAHIMAAFDELDRIVRLDSGALRLDGGETDLSAVITATLAQLAAYTAPRHSGFACEGEQAGVAVAMQRPDAERLVWRLLAGLAGAAAPGEILKLRLRTRDNMARMTVRLPEGLARLGDADLFRAGAEGHAQALSSGVFGLGFALRLATSEAASAGGGLERREDRLRLSLPLAARAGLTHASPTHSDSASAAAHGDSAAAG